MMTPENLDLIREIVSCTFILTGTLLMLLASIGLLRFPDFYIRMSAITKGSILGLSLILLGMGIYFNQPDIFLKVLAVILFTMVTSPIAAHVIGRAAVQNKIPFWERTNLEEFEEYLKQENLEETINRDTYIMQGLKEKKNAAPDGDIGQKA
jgi:multicomponent Na+:H+ antiporter subunit G